MNTYSLVLSSPFDGVQVIKLQATSAEEAERLFESDKDNAGGEVLYVIEHETPPVEIVVDMSNGLVQQVLSNRHNVDIVFLDSSSNEITYEIENGGANFVPDFDLNDSPQEQAKKPSVFRTCEVDYSPEVTHYYVGYTKNDQAVEDFSEKVYSTIG